LGITSSTSEPPQEQVQKLISLYNQQQFEAVLSKVEPMTGLFPQAIVLFNIQGACNSALQRHDSAIDSYKQALKIKPDYAEVYYNLGIALKEKGEPEAAIDSYKQALKIKPDLTQAYNNMGIALKDKGELEAAIDSYKQALKIKPDYADAYINMGVALKDKGDLEAAIDSYKQALKIKPDYAEAYINMGVVLKDKGDLEAVIDSYKQALKIKPDYADAYNNMGNALRDKGDLEAALDSYKQALKIKPDYAEAHRNLSTIKKYELRDEQFTQMKVLYADQTIGDEDRCRICFALAKASEDLENLNESFEYLKEGNAHRKKILSYDIEKDRALFAALKKADLAIPQSALVSIKEPAEVLPIFILGMPRSGTTLVEQIVSSHSKVTGAGELDCVNRLGAGISLGTVETKKENLTDFRERYLAELKKWSEGTPFVTDKMPGNFKNIGLICAAFPEAKIIHVERDPAATCWSNYKQYFPANGLGYCYNLEDLVTYYAMYLDLMQFWRERHTDRIYHLNYEKLTTDQEEETENLIQYLGLNWEEACFAPQDNKRIVRTASQQQVKNKVYQGSSQKWRKFEPFLNGAFDTLKD